MVMGRMILSCTNKMRSLNRIMSMIRSLVFKNSNNLENLYLGLVGAAKIRRVLIMGEHLSKRNMDLLKYLSKRYKYLVKD
jgi:hypothetical protein